MLFRLRRKRRYDGFLTLFFAAWYGTGRFLEDFFRVDVTHGTGLTGSQWTALTVTGLCLYSLLFLRDTPWRSGRGAFESIPIRQREPALDESEAVEPPIDAEEPESAGEVAGSEQGDEEAPVTTGTEPDSRSEEEEAPPFI